MAFGAMALVPEATRFLARYPEITLRFHLTDRRVNLIEEGFDAAIWIGEQSDSNLMSRALAPYRLAPCASPDYIARRGLPLHPTDLRRHECLDYLFPSHLAPPL